SSIYYLYGFFICVFLLNRLLQDGRFSKFLSGASFSGICFLVVCYFFGLGEYKFPPRYNGFFNDPNQMAFWVLCCYSMFCLVVMERVGLKLVLFFACTLVVFASMSRSALVGLVLISAGVLFNLLAKPGGRRRSNGSLISKILLVSVMLAGGVIFISSLGDVSQAMFDRFSDADLGEQADIRGYGRILNFPEYLVFGSGQGLDERFNSPVEIHSTWAGLFFYYGLFGLISFLIFVFLVMRRLSLDQNLIFLGPLFYSFSTFGLRSPIFWVFACVAIFSGWRNSYGD
ncbi:hypothetical protein P3W85_11065, partial [Cupriavidus basilensis]